MELKQAASGTHAEAACADLPELKRLNYFYGQMLGLPPFEIFAASEREFFLTSFDARITFEVDARGRATDLVLNMGTDQRATRVP